MGRISEEFYLARLEPRPHKIVQGLSKARATPAWGPPSSLPPLLARPVVPLALFFELLDVGGRQLRPIDLDRQLVELAGERERDTGSPRRHTGVPVSEPMSKLSSHCRMSGSVRSIFWRGDFLAVHLEHAGAAAADAAHVVEGQRARRRGRRT